MQNHLHKNVQLSNKNGQRMRRIIRCADFQDSFGRSKPQQGQNGIERINPGFSMRYRAGIITFIRLSMHKQIQRQASDALCNLVGPKAANQSGKMPLMLARAIPSGA